MSKLSPRVKMLTEAAIIVALSTVLSMIKFEMPLGGSITLFSMVPLIILSFKNGVKWGLGAAFVYSIVQLVLGLGVFSYVPTLNGIILCAILDYTVAFTVLGLAGIMNYTKLKPLVKVLAGAVLVCVLRYITHVISGAVVWYEITKEGQWNDYVFKYSMWIYSMIYNAQYMVPETIMAAVASPIIMKFITRKNNKISA